MVLYLIYLACLLFSAIIAFVYREALKSRQLSILIPYLFLVFIQEVCVFLCRRYIEGFSTNLIYNLYRPVSTFCFAWLFYHIPFNVSIRKMILWMQVLYLALTAVVYLFITPIRQYNSFLSLVAGMIITIYALFLLFNYFNLDNITEEKKWKPLTWICAGLVTFYPVVNIFFAFSRYIHAKQIAIMGTMLYNAVPQLLSIFMYGCFAYAFYLCKKKN
ncbi:MAG: hypothetical protein ABIR18_04805 [Chitinophagaceae bacterium]